MYVLFFRCESFPYISRRVDWFHCALFPCHSPCTPLFFMSVPVMSVSLPLCLPFISRCFPDMWTSYFLPSFPCTSLHFPFAPQYFPQKNTVFSAFAQRGRPKTTSFSRFFLALPCISPWLPSIFNKQHGFSSVFAKRTSKNTEFFHIFCKSKQETQTSKKPAGGIEPDPCFATPAPRRLRLVERHQIAARYVGEGGEACVIDVSGGNLFLGIRHAKQCRWWV